MCDTWVSPQGFGLCTKTTNKGTGVQDELRGPGHRRLVRESHSHAQKVLDRKVRAPAFSMAAGGVT